MKTTKIVVGNPAREALYSEMFIAGRGYLKAEAYELRKGRFVVVLSKIRKVGKRYEASQITLESDHLDAFADAFGKAALFVKSQ